MCGVTGMLSPAGFDDPRVSFIPREGKILLTIQKYYKMYRNT